MHTCQTIQEYYIELFDMYVFKSTCWALIFIFRLNSSHRDIKFMSRDVQPSESYTHRLIAIKNVIFNIKVLLDIVSHVEGPSARVIRRRLDD